MENASEIAIAVGAAIEAWKYSTLPPPTIVHALNVATPEEAVAVTIPIYAPLVLSR
jgi:hypothetical protein